MSERVLVIGAGVAGLTAALALARRGFEVVIVDRDEPIDPDLTPANSWAWRRRSAPQVQQPHFLMGRLRNLLHAHYPGLIAALFDAGVWELPFADTVHPIARANYEPVPGDADMTPLCARRTTFELVMRRYVEQHGIARLQAGCRVDGLILAQDEGTPKVVGCQATTAEGQVELFADVVIDASGRSSSTVSTLRAAGIAIDEELHRSETIYNTRHYRLREGQDFPPLTGLPAVDFPDFTLGALPADNGTLTVTLAVWKDDAILSKVAKNAAFFDSVCAQVPKIRPWVDPARVEPLSGVLSFANMDYLWRRTVVNGRPSVLNYFLAGDSTVRTNPKFGRGCTWAAVGVDKLAEILASEADPTMRSLRYDEMLWSEFRADWETMFAIEQGTRRKFLSEIGRGRKSVRLRLTALVESHVMNVAMLADARVQRAIMRGYHGLDGMSDWARNPKLWFNIAMTARPTSKMRGLSRANTRRPDRLELAAMLRESTIAPADAT